ncbi:YwmB family TATA-box binding protein [Bacillus sp. FJAT-27251]|uniref:YwmB family TATA-box binding protein n=1 Tax=Bacillus sp. FJAT-27251 TaxID=1684142 RepID=UPI0006A773B7|nr:YwmB family TATA-box binding protein [Bacillus sp. FJAT-27251]
MHRILWTLSIFGMIGFIVLQAGNRTTVANVDQELATMASVLKDEHILINEWSLYARNEMKDVKEQADQEKLAAELQAKFPNWSWEETAEGQHHSLTATSVSSGYTEKIKITASGESGHLRTYVLYEVRGHSWNRRSESFLNEEWQNRLFDIFRGNHTTFSCIKGEISDMIGSSLPNHINGLLEAFNAEEVEALEEETFISTSAYSPLFSGKLSKDHGMNLQLGLRKPDGMGGKTTVVVGTPIITIEY